jgi:hypothetical protein
VNPSFVCATSKGTSDVVHFSSYLTRRNSSDLLRTTKIWEAARATLATSSLFDPITIGIHGEEFVGGENGANNPDEEAYNEAADLWPKIAIKDNIKCLVSIGTGVPSLKPFGENMVDIGNTLVAIAKDSERTAGNFARYHSTLSDKQQYFRFNVTGLEDIGLEDVSQRKLTAAATRRYIASQACFEQLQVCGRCLAERACS